jgi:hypothetical protein
MKKIISLILLFQVTLAFSQENTGYISAYFERPLSCPLRFSNLSELRDRVQALAATLGNSCTQSGQQALNQLNSSVSNLEGIATTWSTQQGTDQKAQNAQLAKNAGQVLGSLNIITSNQACFYDIRSRGALPVIADIVMSLSQLGLLIPSATGTMVATGGFIAGSGLKIINELVKRKFNWNKPEERRAFLQLNCAFFDNRRVIEEMGLFNPETKMFREKLSVGLKKERLQLIKIQKEHEKAIISNEALLNKELASIPSINQAGINPLLSNKLDELTANLSSRPGDYAAKWKQVSVLANLAPQIKEMLSELKLEAADDKIVKIMLNNLTVMTPDLAQDAKAWTSTIDEYEIKYRGPAVAFANQISEVIKKTTSFMEAETSAENRELGIKINDLKKSIRESKSMAWGASQRLLSVEAKIASLDTSDSQLFSLNDQGKSDAVEILDHYRKLQKSILGKEGKGYLKNSMENMDNVLEGLNKHLFQLSEASEGTEKCAAVEKLKFVWAQYRYKAQESYDFVATNLDLYRSSYKIGNERQKKSTNYVLKQIESIDYEEQGHAPASDSVGYYMKSVKELMIEVEGKLESSGCL